MNGGKRTQRKTAAPTALPVPRMRAIRSDDIAEPVETVENRMRPRRHRKPKFVF